MIVFAIRRISAARLILTKATNFPNQAEDADLPRRTHSAAATLHMDVSI